MATGSDPEGERACATGFPALFLMFSDMLCSTPAFSLGGVSKSTFEHPIEGHSAFYPGL